jgi:CheY-like chemotaxis protein
MDGQVGVHSAPGQGSTFWFTARLRKSDMAAPAGLTTALAQSPVGLQGARVLLVEDNLINQEVASGLLRSAGVEVLVAGDGQQALEMINQHRFDLVLMDMQMPVMDGLTATRAIRARSDWRHLPVVAMTANAMPADREACLESGMDDFVAKPIEPEILMRALVRWIPARPPQNRDKPVVLVVHSEPDRLSWMHSVLKASYKVKVANSAQRALDIQRADPAPDVVVLPANLPGLDGWALSEQLQAQQVCPLLILAAQPHEVVDAMPARCRLVTTDASAQLILQEISALLA